MQHETALLRYWRDLNHACPLQHITLDLASALHNLGYSVADAATLIDFRDDGIDLADVFASARGVYGKMGD